MSEPEEPKSALDEAMEIFATTKNEAQEIKLREPIGNRLRELGYTGCRIFENLRENLEFMDREKREIKGMLVLHSDQITPDSKQQAEAAVLLAADFAVYNSATFIGSEKFDLDWGNSDFEIIITHPSSKSPFAWVNYEGKVVILSIANEASGATAELTPDDVRKELKRYFDERLSDGLEAEEK